MLRPATDMALVRPHGVGEVARVSVELRHFSLQPEASKVPAH
jgi:hypothetical protein